jgi:hypothetical protein
MSVTWAEVGRARGRVFDEITGKVITGRDSRRYYRNADLEVP